MENFVTISGCSGGGKSTLLAELASRGHHVVTEPGRRIVEMELAGDGRALPWNDLAAFARRAVSMAIEDMASAMMKSRWVFFDRGLVDAAVALETSGESGAVDRLCRNHRFHRTVFMTPPWPEIFETDPERRHDLSSAVGEYDRLMMAYTRLGYDIALLPKTGVADRADWLLGRLGPPPVTQR